MQNQVEEIVLLSTNDERKHQNDNNIFIGISNDYPINKHHSKRFIRLLKPIDRSNICKNILLWIILFGFLFILSAPLALKFSHILPTIRSRTIPLHEFSEERARDFYPYLTKYGPRVSNTQADYLTREFLLTEIRRIRSMTKPFIQFDISLQNFSSNGIDQLQNIAVRLFNSNSSPNTSSLMLTAHYDSVEFSPGASDNGLGVVILLELLSNLVMDPEITFNQVHLIVFFTAAEEMHQKGAETFIADHPWKNTIRRFINIDSLGGREKAILFRVKPSQLVNDYRHVPRPHANVIGDEIFDYVGADTDYTTFTFKGSLLGYDFAFYLDGYTYHTSLDQSSVIKDGALQHLGENILVLSRNILLGNVNLQQPETIIDDDNIIYFDILGRYLVTYSKTTSIILQSILIGFIIIIGLIIIIFDHIWSKKNSSIDDFASIYFYFQYPLFVRLCSILVFFICYLLSIIFGIFFTIIIAYSISKFRPMSWYGNATLAFFLYGLICLIIMIFCEILWTFARRWCLLKYSKTNPMERNTINHIDRLYFNFERHFALLLIFILLMSISICLGYRSLYPILVWSIFVCPIYLIIILLEFLFRWLRKKYRNPFDEQGWYWLLAPYFVSLLPLIHTLEMTSRVIRLIIPLMSRIVYLVHLPHDLIISSLIVIPAILFFLIFIPNAQRMMNYSRTLILLIVSFLIVLLVACLRQPYTSTHPRIIGVQHQSKIISRLINPQTFPMIISMYPQDTTITVHSYDNLPVSSILDQYSYKTGYLLNYQPCIMPSICVLNDTFNRTIAFKQVELTSIDTMEKYQFIIRHLSSYQIIVNSSSSIDIVVHNATMKPRTETIIDVQLTDSSSLVFHLNITIQRCDLNDSPFILSLTKTLPSIVMWGTSRCESLTDTLHLIVNNS